MFANDFSRIFGGLQSSVFIHKGANLGIKILVFLYVDDKFTQCFNKKLFYDEVGRDIYFCLFNKLMFYRHLTME